MMECLECGVGLVTDRVWRSIPKHERPSDKRRHAGRGLCTRCEMRVKKEGRLHQYNQPVNVESFDRSLQVFSEDLPCLGLNPDWFFSFEEEETRKAIDACQSCPSRNTCLAAAIEHQEYWGIWGGQYIFEGRIVDPAFYRAQLQEAA